MIRKIVLQNFRQFRKFELNIQKPVLILVGNNTKGKTTVLESIYLAINGFSPWAIGRNDLINKDSDFVTVSLFDSADGTLVEDKFTYFQSQKKKLFKKNDLVINRKEFTKNRLCTIFSPEQVDLLMFIPAKRRAFLDAMIKKFDMEYENVLKDFNKTLKQRNSYLKKLRKIFFEQNILKTSDTQLSLWTQQFVRTSVKVFERRVSFSRRLQHQLYSFVYYPFGSKDIRGEDISEELLTRLLQENVKKDIVTGNTSIGPHRDDWTIFDPNKNIKQFGSRGEKRKAIVELILMTQNIMKEEKGFFPVLLLDDISAELDDHNISAVLSEENVRRQQTFITTTRVSLIPQHILDMAQIYELS